MNKLKQESSLSLARSKKCSHDQGFLLLFLLPGTPYLISEDYAEFNNYHSQNMLLSIFRALSQETCTTLLWCM